MLLTYQVIYTFENIPQQIEDFSLENDISEARFLNHALSHISDCEAVIDQLVKISLCVYTGGNGYFVLPKWVNDPAFTGKYYFGVCEK